MRSDARQDAGLRSAKLEVASLELRMPAEIILQQSPDAAALLDKREQLATVRTTLAERESELAQIRAQLKTFEGRYLRQVGILYAELDDLEARIAEREVDLYDSDSARRRAEETRRQAQETHDAAFGDAREAEEFDPPPSLKTLFRDVAKRIHPDFARDDAEQKHFTLLMARANQAYSRGDTETLQRLLDDHREINASIAGEGAAAELLRITRQIQHAERDIATLDAERHTLLAGEVAQLHRDAEAAAREHRDLLTELATSLREQIADAQRRFERMENSMEDKAKAGLQHLPTGSALSLHSPKRSSIIARGRRDAANAASNPHYRQGVTDYNAHNFAEAAASFGLAAEQGHAESQYLLSTMYDAGHGLPQDDTQAAYWERKAAEQGHAYAQANLSFRFYAADNFPEAFAWCERAAHSKLAWAQYNLGLMYRKGEGVPQSDAEAAHWYRLAAAQNFPEAQVKLADLYYFGHGVLRSLTQAAAWYRRAADLGNPEAQFQLG